MRRVIGFGMLAAVLLVCVSGCVQSKTVMTVRKDGSGTIERTSYVRKFEAFDVKEPEKSDAALASEYDAVAKRMGATVKSLEQLKDRPGSTGVHVVFAFTDVSKVVTSAMPPVNDAVEKDDEMMHFVFEKGAQNKLTVAMPAMKSLNPGGDGYKKPSPEEEAAQDGVMKTMFKDLLIDFVLIVDGNIVQTNAAIVNTAKDGVMLIHEDFGGMIQDEVAMKAFKALSTIKDIKVLKEKVQDPAIKKYIHFDPNENVVLEFK